MEQEQLFESLKARGHKIGASMMSEEGFQLINVDGHLLKQTEAERLLDGASIDDIKNLRK